MIHNRNQDQGISFEKVFQMFCELSGIFVEKNNLTAKFLPGGRVQAFKSELDFKLIFNKKVAYIDCKSFFDDSFSYSKLNKDQLSRALKYESLGLISGFVVWYIDVDKVCFFSASSISKKGARSSFRAEDGVLLGSINKIDVISMLNYKPILMQHFDAQKYI